MSIQHIHDAWFLWGLQHVYYGYSWLTAPLSLFLLIGLPVQRRAASLLTSLMAIFAMLCLACYGVLAEAPLLGWTLIAGLVYFVARSILWGAFLSKSSVADTSLVVRILPRAFWFNFLIRDYWRADPRGVFWLDLARVVHGFQLERSRVSRSETLSRAWRLPAWRRFLWHRVIFPLIECRIWLFSRLPSWWHEEHTKLALDEMHVLAILESEIEHALTQADECQGGASFDAYRLRIRDAEEFALSQSQAARWAHTHCLLREAMAEALSFRKPWMRNEAPLESVAIYCFETWRVRRQYESLWEQERKLEEQAFRESEAAKETANEHAPDADSLKDDDEHSEAAEQVARETDEPTEFDESDEIVTSETDDEDLEVDVEDQDEDDAEGRTEEVVQGMPAVISVEGNDETPVVTDEMQTAGDPDFDEDENEDERLFSTVEDVEDPEDEATILESPDEVEATGADGDLVTACRLLAAFLELDLTGNFNVDIKAAEQCWTHPKKRVVATRLLMLYCLRTDFKEKRLDRVKLELISRLRTLFAEMPSKDEAAQKASQVFAAMLIDYFFSRGAYGRVCDLFAKHEPQTPHQWRILGIALMHVAEQVRDQPKIRDIPLRNALEALFQARVPGLWTQQYAGVLLGTNSAAETLKLLDAYPVAFGRSELERRVEDIPAAARTDRKMVLSPLLLLYVNKNQVVPVRRSPLTLGSAADCAIQLSMAHPHHCRFYSQDGKWYVEDVTHTGNGVFVNGRPRQKCVLKLNDTLLLGKAQFEVTSV